MVSTFVPLLCTAYSNNWRSDIAFSIPYNLKYRYIHGLWQDNAVLPVQVSLGAGVTACGSSNVDSFGEELKG